MHSGTGHRHWDLTGAPADHLRALPAGRQLDDSLARRPRARVGHRSPPRRSAWRHRRGFQRGARIGGYVHRHAAASSGLLGAGGIRQRPRSAGAVRRARASEERLEGSRILIVDDDADSLDLLRVLLEEAGAAVTPVANAASALEQSTSTRFDLVVSDIGMPEMDGYTFMRRLRATHSAIPAIALTAYARAEDATRARAAGYQEHIAKPVDGGELVSTIERLLEAPTRGP